MSSVIEQERPAAAFTDPIDDSLFRASSASGYGAEFAEPMRRAMPPPEQARIRWLIALLSREKRQSRQFHSVPNELPRLQHFREQFQTFLRAPISGQLAQRGDIVAQIRSAADPAIYLHEVLRQCSIGGGPNSFDLAIDLLSGFDTVLLEVLESFLNFDRPRWHQATAAHHVNDDVCYTLLRALARSNIAFQTTIDLIADCLDRGTSSIREAAVHALADIGGDAAQRLLKQAAEQDSDRQVRESAQEALSDMGA